MAKGTLQDYFVRHYQELKQATNLETSVVKTNETETYPDGNPKTAAGAKKPALALVPTALMVHTAAALSDGVRKYGQANWREKGVAASVYLHAALRHLYAYIDGENVAEDSGAHHLGHAVACLAIILDAESCGKLLDDRPTANPNTPILLKGPQA